MQGPLRLFAATPPGLENITQAELRQLGINGEKPMPGGVEFDGDLRMLYVVNLWLRSAQRVLVRLDGFFVVHLAKLRKKLDQVPFESFLNPHVPIEVRATCKKSRIYHSKAAAERAALAIKERLGLCDTPYFGEGAPLKEGDRMAVLLRIEKDHCTISLDSSGEHLHRRGYRSHSHEAPLRENLAAAMLYKMGYDGAEHFWDPMCGSGTLPIEAALMATNTAPGRDRKFAFMNWPGFDADMWSTLVEAAENARQNPSMLIGGSDIDENAVEISRLHARAAGVDEWVRLEVKPIEKLSLSQVSGMMVSNPPYGKRIGERKQLKDLYHSIGECIVRHSDRWRLGLVAPDAYLVASTGLDMRPCGAAFPNGGLRVRFHSTVQ